MTDYTELVKALRCKGMSKRCCTCTYGYRLCPDSECNDACHVEQIIDDAAAAIEALETEIRESMQKCAECGDANIPKLGEWIYHPKDAIEMMFTLPKCSICGHESSDALNYCPNCGAKMNDSNASNALNALDNAQDGPIITPCRGCSDYDGYGGCKSKGGCARARMEVQK